MKKRYRAEETIQSKRPKWHWWLGGLIAILALGGIGSLTKPAQPTGTGQAVSTGALTPTALQVNLALRTALARQTSTAGALQLAVVALPTDTTMPSVEPTVKAALATVQLEAPPTPDAALISSRATATAYAQPVPTWTPQPVVSQPKQPQPKPCTSNVRIGATCVDGTHSTVTGRGACSKHGGVSTWLYGCP